MASLVQHISIVGLLLVCFVIYTQQLVISTSSSGEQYDFGKRLIDAHSRSSIPLFRGSSLGIFVRKRPLSPEHSMTRRKEARALTNNDENNLAELSDDFEYFQRRFDDYSENPGPMFGR